MKDYHKGHNEVVCVRNNGRHTFKCPVCGRPLIVDDGEKWKLKTRIVIFLKGETLAKCKYCRNDIKVPVKFDQEVALKNFEKRKELSIDPERN